MNLRHLEILCNGFHLGILIGDAKAVHGSRGGSHIWRVNTDLSSYAIKQLSPSIDLPNEKIIARYELTETVASRFTQKGIQAIVALEKSGKRLTIIDNIGYLVYPWIEGTMLGRNEISEFHAIKIAEILAKLHSAKLIVPEMGEPRFDIHTNDKIVSEINKATIYNFPFAKKLKDMEGVFLSINDSYQSVIPILKERTVVTHGDMDQNNVLWDSAGQPILIDWEAIKKMNPTRELLRTCFAWSGIINEDSSLSIYTKMIETYVKSGGFYNKSHVEASLYAAFGNSINWLLYNIDIACESKLLQERENSAREISTIIDSIPRYKELMPILLQVNIS